MTDAELEGMERDFEKNHLRRLQQECDELRHKYEESVLAGDRLAWERDEARDVARRLMQDHVTDWAYLAELRDAYPWLENDAG